MRKYNYGFDNAWGVALRKRSSQMKRQKTYIYKWAYRWSSKQTDTHMESKSNNNKKEMVILYAENYNQNANEQIILWNV